MDFKPNTIPYSYFYNTIAPMTAPHIKIEEQCVVDSSFVNGLAISEYCYPLAHYEPPAFQYMDNWVDDLTSASSSPVLMNNQYDMTCVISPEYDLYSYPSSLTASSNYASPILTATTSYQCINTSPSTNYSDVQSIEFMNTRSPDWSSESYIDPAFMQIMHIQDDFDPVQYLLEPFSFTEINPNYTHLDNATPPSYIDTTQLIPKKEERKTNTHRPFSCHICQRPFTRKHDLQRHIRVHTGAKPYSCPCCKKAFARSDALHRHLTIEVRCQQSKEVQAMKKNGKRNYQHSRLRH